MTTTGDPLALKVAHHLFDREGTGRVWGICIEEVRIGYARLAMPIRPDMTNGHGIVHGGMTFALADTAFAYACNSRNHAAVGQTASIIYLAPARLGETLVAEACEDAVAGRSGVYRVLVSVKERDEIIAHFQGQSRTLGGRVVEDDDELAEGSSNND